MTSDLQTYRRWVQSTKATGPEVFLEIDTYRYMTKYGIFFSSQQEKGLVEADVFGSKYLADDLRHRACIPNAGPTAHMS